MEKYRACAAPFLISDDGDVATVSFTFDDDDPIVTGRCFTLRKERISDLISLNIILLGANFAYINSSKEEGVGTDSGNVFCAKVQDAAEWVLLALRGGSLDASGVEEISGFSNTVGGLLTVFGKHLDEYPKEIMESLRACGEELLSLVDHQQEAHICQPSGWVDRMSPATPKVLN